MNRQKIASFNVLFVAGFGPVVKDTLQHSSCLSTPEYGESSRVDVTHGLCLVRALQQICHQNTPIYMLVGLLRRPESSVSIV